MGIGVQSGRCRHELHQLWCAAIGRVELVCGLGSTALVCGFRVGGRAIQVDVAAVNETAIRTMEPSVKASAVEYHRCFCIERTLGPSYHWHETSAKLSEFVQRLRTRIDLETSKSLYPATHDGIPVGPTCDPLAPPRPTALLPPKVT